MSKTALHIETPEEAETVFYEALLRGDLEVIKAVWSREDVVCIHPGSGVISGYDAVIRSWSHILENNQGPDIRYSMLNKTSNEELSVHLVSEEILQDGVVVALVVATNIYRKYDHGWLMLEHHSSVVHQEHKGETLQ